MMLKILMQYVKGFIDSQKNLNCLSAVILVLQHQNSCSVGLWQTQRSRWMSTRAGENWETADHQTLRRKSGMLEGGGPKLQVPMILQSDLSQLLLWQRKASLGRQKNKSWDIPAPLGTPYRGGDVLIAGICCHELRSASISNTTVIYTNCSLSAPWHPASELAPTLQYLCWFRWEQGCVQHN